MAWGPIQPAEIAVEPGGQPLAQAREVFLSGNGLPARWQGQARFVVLEIGFGLGHNFLATWAAWRAHAARSARLVFVSIEKHPPRRDDLQRALARHADDTAIAPLAQALLAAWPPATPDIHLLDFEAGAVQLQLAFGDIATVLPKLTLQADALYLDGFAPAQAQNPALWDARLLKHLQRLAAPGATAATGSLAAAVRDGLQQAGFVPHKAVGLGGMRQRLEASFQPRHQPPPPPGRLSQPGLQHAVVIGAGLAGAAAARALALQGLRVDVYERRHSPAAETSGNPGGLFHGTVHAQDGTHARWLRAAALRTTQLLRPLIAQGLLPGQINGLLRGADTDQPDTAATLQAMHALKARSGLPDEYVQVLADGWPSAGHNAEVQDHDASRPAWLYPGGGWVSPAALVRHWLQTPGIRLHCEASISALQADAEHPGTWHLLDAQGRPLARSAAVVLANADQALALLQGVHPDLGPAHWPIGRRRGQTTLLPAEGWPEGHALPGLPRPVAAGSYALRLLDASGQPLGPLLCGATQQPGDEDPYVRAEDHAQNLAALQRLTGWRAPPGAIQDTPLEGRVGWRLMTDDRLPLVGAVPRPRPQGLRLEQPRHIPRLPGLWLLTALGSRGITQAALAGELLAAWVTGAPVPLPADLVDALDPARFIARARRRGHGAPG